MYSETDDAESINQMWLSYNDHHNKQQNYILSVVIILQSLWSILLLSLYINYNIERLLEVFITIIVLY